MNALPSREHAHTIHQQLLGVLREHRSAEHRAATLLRRISDERLHHALGFATIGEYAEQALDLTVRQARALVQIAGALPTLPALDAAFASGEVGWTKARELVRVVTPETEAQWVQRARDWTSRELERAVSHAARGDAPPAEPPPGLGPERVRVWFELEAAHAAIVRDALAMVQGQAALAGEELDAGAALAMIAQRALHDADGELAPTGPRHQLVVEVCPSCAASSSRDHEVSEEVVAQACCDAEVLDLSDGPTRGHLSRTPPPATRRAVIARDRGRCVVPGCRCRLWLDVHHLRYREHGGDHAEDNLVTLCPLHHRLVHAGMLAITRSEDGRVEVVRSDGRRAVSRPTWVAGGERPTWDALGHAGAVEDAGARRPSAMPPDAPGVAPTSSWTREG